MFLFLNLKKGSRISRDHSGESGFIPELQWEITQPARKEKAHWVGNQEHLLYLPVRSDGEHKNMFFLVEAGSLLIPS